MNITVYAASSGQVPDVYLQAARDLGTCLAARGHTLVNGAGRTGLMGATIDGIQAAGGRARRRPATPPRSRAPPREP